MSQTDDSQIKAWWKEHLDPVIPAAPPFDRDRWHRVTLPDAAGRPLPRRPWPLAAAAVLVLVLAWGGLKALGGTGSTVAGTASASPAAASFLPATAIASLYAAKAAVPASASPAYHPSFMSTAQHGVLAQELSRPRTIARPAAVIAVGSALASARPVLPGTYHCPAQLGQPVTVWLDLPHGQRDALYLSLSGCQWFYITSGVPSGPSSFAAAMAARRLYWIPAELPALLSEYAVPAATARP
ncbi:MAG: hypothetical protein M0Z53_06270 [Thermaerobacter sp.]|nr:hypothetical protein [Thermaerobacter sp.]